MKKMKITQWKVPELLFVAITIVFTLTCCDNYYNSDKIPRPAEEIVVQSGDSRPSRRRHHEDFEAVYPCPDHIFPFCTDENPFGITYKSSTKGYAAFPRSANIGCLVTAPGPSWYYMQIAQPGELLIYIEQKGLLGKLDVDFACWGPFEAKSKGEFLDKICASYYKLNTEQHPNHRPEKGNHRGDTGGYPFGNLVDCSFHPAGTEWCYIPNAKTGEWYLLLLTNYSRQPGIIHFERVDEMSTATTNCEIVTPVKLKPVPQGLRKIDDHTTAICLYENKALVTIELEAEEGYTLPRRSLQKCQVMVYADNKSYQATLNKDHFECVIDITNDTTKYYSKITCPSPKFELDTETYFIVRTTDCDPDLIKYIKSSPHHAGDRTIIELLKGDKPVNVDFSDPNGVMSILPNHPETFNLDNYDLSVDYDHLFVERVIINKDGNNLILTPQLKGEWCDCLIPDTMTFRLKMTPNRSDLNIKPYEIPIQIGITHPDTWIKRCLWALILIGVLLLLILYLMLLMHKKRFKKNAMVTPTYYDYYGNKREAGSLDLRKKGFGPWFSRWFLPSDERNTLSFDKPTTSLLFVAAESFDTVKIPKEGNIDPATMEIKGYNPNKDQRPKEPVRLGNRGKINVLDNNGSEEGFLTFTSGNAVDGIIFRIILSILIVAAATAIVTLLFLMTRSAL